MAGERHAALEGLERFIERQVTALESFDELFELGKGLLEVGFFGGSCQAGFLGKRGHLIQVVARANKTRRRASWAVDGLGPGA